MYEKTRSAMPLGLNQELNQSNYESNYQSIFFLSAKVKHSSHPTKFVQRISHNFQPSARFIFS